MDSAIPSRESMQATIAAQAQRIHALEEQHAQLTQQIEQLNESQVLLQGIIDDSPLAMFVYDVNGTFLLFNQHAALLTSRFHHPTHEPQDEPESSSNSPSPSRAVMSLHEEDQQIIATGEPLQTEHTISFADGERTFVTVKFPIFDDNGNVSAIGGISTDITTHKRAINELHMFKTLVETSSDGIAVDTFGTIIYTNESLQHMLGYRHEEMVQAPVTSFLTDESRAHVAGILEHVKAHGHWQGMLAHRHKDGHTLPFMVSVSLVCDTHGTPYAVSAIMRDVRELQLQEQALKQSEERLRTIIDKIPAGVCITNAEYTFEYVNPAYCDIYQYTPDELIGHDFTMVVPEADRRMMHEIHDIFLRDGYEMRGEWQVVRKDGTLLTILADAAAIVGADGEQKKVTFVMDITDRKQSEQAHAMLQQQLIEAQQAAIRELSTPLLPIAENILVMPLVGSIDSSRAQLVMETLLEGIAAQQADIAIVDITGIKVVDTQVAQALIQTAQAVKLLGAQVILTGIGPSMAQTLIHLGADLNDIVTRSSLQRGIAYAMEHQHR